MPWYKGLNGSSDPDLAIVERAEITVLNGGKYLLYVIGLQQTRSEQYDLIHSISSKDGRGSVGLKFCPLENLASYQKFTL